MKTGLACSAMWVALACLCTGPAIAADAAFDAGAAWDTFLASAQQETVFGAYDALDQVGYDGDQVDADACRSHGDGLAQALAKAPVSLALRRADYLCAQATGDTARAAQASAILLALSREALSRSGDYQVGRPIRVLAPIDASALVLSSGMEVAYLYYPWARPSRYFPLVIAARDPQSGVERHLAFDFVDTSYAIDRHDPMSGFPILRNHWANGYVQSAMGQQQSFAIDSKAMLDAAYEDSDTQKLAHLRQGADVGGIMSLNTWLEICALRPAPHCADGLVDALLPRSEAHDAYPLVLLAIAHLQGVGVARDADAAWALLDEADRRWRGGEAIAQFTRIWIDLNDKAPLPAALQQRLAKAQAAGNRYPQRLQIQRVLAAGAKAELDAAQVAFLADPAENELGEGDAELADYYEAHGDQPRTLQWMVKAAEAGGAAAQSRYGFALDGGQFGLKPDPVAARRMLELAAQGGASNAARYLSYLSAGEGRWADAEKWLLQPVAGGNVDALMALAALYVEQRPGVSGDQAHGLEIYRDLDRAGFAQARRALAELALTGQAMDKDPAKAKAWLLADAGKGDADSQVRLAQAYFNGDFGAVDAGEGARWAKQAIDAGNADAINVYASWLYNQDATASARQQAIALWRKGDANGSEISRNDYAWALCTGEDADMDPALALQMLQRVGTPAQMNPSTQDTLAACYAASGDYAQAARTQADVIARVDRLMADDTAQARAKRLQGFQERLALYKASKRYRLERSPASRPNSSESVTTSPTKKR